MFHRVLNTYVSDEAKLVLLLLTLSISLALLSTTIFPLSSLKTSIVFKEKRGQKWILEGNGLISSVTTSHKTDINKFLASIHNLPFHDRADIDTSISFFISLSNNADAKEVYLV